MIVNIASQDNLVLQAALAYAKDGWPVLPLRGKKPLTKHGVKDATCDETQIKKWWKQHPNANIGIVAGDSSGLLVLDIDIKKGKRGDESLQELEKEYGLLPKTLKAQTVSGGWHFVFRMPAGGRKSCKEVRNGIDLLANGSYFVAAPSTIHDKAYRWVEQCEAAPCPEWLASLNRPSALEKVSIHTRAVLIRELFPNGREANGQWETRCPFHDDDTPSFYVKLKDGVFFCHACDAKGSFETLYAKIKNISVHEARRILRPIPPFIEELNKEHAIVKIGGKCVILNEEPHSTEKWNTISFSSRADFFLQYQNRTVRINDKWVPVAPKWLNHPARRQYRGIDFAPPPKILRSDYYNLWQGFAVEPRQGDCSLYLELVHEVAAQNNPGLTHYILGQMAQAVQQPAIRNGISLVFTGKQGTGKSVLMTQFGSLWGPHFFHARDWRQLTGNFNAHLKNISLLFADEVTSESSVADGVLKALITEEWIPIEFKGKDVIQVKNFIRVMMATNKIRPVPAGLEERRFSVIEMGEGHMQDRPFFGAINEQMNNGGREALLHHLLNYDIRDIDLDKPYETTAHLHNKLLSMSRAERFWFEILDRGTVDDPIWSSMLNKERLYQAYLCYAHEEMGHGIQTAFWMALRKLCPHIREVTYKGKKCVEVGSLKQCRDAFDGVINWLNHTWEAPEVETDVPLIRLPLPQSKRIEVEEYPNFDQFRSEEESKGGEAYSSV